VEMGQRLLSESGSSLAMATVDVYDVQGKAVGKADLDDALFGIEPSEGAIYQTIKAHQTNKRQGTAATKTRAEVFLTKRKMYRQKGTGRARAGKASSPIRVGGGIAHGPQPRFYKERVPQKVRVLALRSAFSLKASSDGVKVLQDFEMEVPKTKTIAEIMKAMEVDGDKTLMLIDEHDGNIAKSCRNIPGLSVLSVGQVCTYDVMHADRVVFTESALGRAQGLWGAS
jgi:large subunit ribosomal protein L4